MYELTNFISNSNASYGAKEYSIKILAFNYATYNTTSISRNLELFGCKSFLYNEKWPQV